MRHCGLRTMSVVRRCWWFMIQAAASTSDDLGPCESAWPPPAVLPGPAVTIHLSWWRSRQRDNVSRIFLTPSMFVRSEAVRAESWVLECIFRVLVLTVLPPTMWPVAGCSVWGRGQKGGKYRVQGGGRVSVCRPAPPLCSWHNSDHIAARAWPMSGNCLPKTTQDKRVKVIFVVLVNFVLGSVNSAHL